MNEGKVKNLRMYFVYALGYRLMQLAAKRMGNEGLHRFGGGHFFTFGDWHTFGVQGKGQDPVRRDEKTKSVVKSVVQRDQPTNHPSNPPNQPTSQKNKNFVGPRVGKRIY
jgi:poly(A) polymerase Pap1